MIVQRHLKIVEYLRKKEIATIDELCDVFQVSKNTIRSDVNRLESQGLVKKVYGGVVFVDREKVIPLSVRQGKYVKQKDSIGKTAASLVNDNDIITVDSGSTTLPMIKYLRNRNNVTIITDSLSIANEGFQFNNLNIIMVGGNLLRNTCSFIGTDSMSMLSRLNSSMTFVAATGVSISRGLTNSSMIESDMKKAMIKSSEKSILMVDSSKFNMVSLITFCELSDIDIVITDSRIDEEYRNYFDKNNVKLIIAE